MIDPMSDPARFGVGLSQAAEPARAAREACAAVREGLGPGVAPHLVVIFASPALCDGADALLEEIDDALAPGHLIGCMGEAIVGAGREVEDGPALAVWAAHLPGAEAIPFRLVARPIGEGLGVLGWPDALADAPAGNVGPVVMLADPFTFPADGLLAQLNEEPGAPVVVGGLASGGRRPGDHRLFAGADVLTEGAVGVALRGARIRTVVSQGCKPIGPEMVITAAEGSRVHELAGVAAMEKLEEVVDGLDAIERALAGQGIMAGLVIDENTPDYERGDFLDPLHPRRGPRERRPGGGRAGARGSDDALPRARRGLGRRGSAGGAASGPRRAGGHRSWRGAGVQLQRARHPDVPGTRPRRRGHRRGARSHPHRRLVLQR